MSLGIAFKGAEGIVLAADSRVTLMAQLQRPEPPQAGGPALPTLVVPATFDNATKLLHVPSQSHIAAITYGAGAIGAHAPRTAASFIPEFDAEIAKEKRMNVEAFAHKLSDFFVKQWTAGGMPTQSVDDMVFLVAGYDDEKAPYGRIWEVHVPSNPKPVELLPNQFGAAWGGQREYTDRVLQGFDPGLPMLIQQYLKVPDQDQKKAAEDLGKFLSGKLTVPIPWQFLPLQDCVDMSIFLVRTTITLQKWLVGVRGVGGAIDIATITRTDGFKAVQQKKISGEQVQ